MTRWEDKSNRLAEEVFRRIEADQGYSYISDGIEVNTPEQIFALMRRSIKHHKICVVKLNRILRKYNQETA